MNKIGRLVTPTLFFMPMVFTPASLLAQSPFDGTWITEQDQSKPSQKPVVVSLNKGIFLCSSCNPKVEIKADGTDHPVAGLSFDTESVREIDAKKVAFTDKKAGKILYEKTAILSDDGNTLTQKVIFHLENSDQTMNQELTFTRLEKGPAGAHETTGAWRFDKNTISENARTSTYKSSGEAFSMSTPIGVSYAAELDGKDYPVKGGMG